LEKNDRGVFADLGAAVRSFEAIELGQSIPRPRKRRAGRIRARVRPAPDRNVDRGVPVAGIEPATF
jgi:hypothetical protein